MDCVGICGSDMHYLVHGRIGDFVVNKPMVIGREAAGVVVKCGKSVKNLVVGDRVAIVPGVPCRLSQFCKTGKYNLCPDMVFCATPPYDGNLKKYYRHAADFFFKLPPNVTMEEGALLEPLSVGVHACRRADVGLGSEVLILGAGPIGLVTLLVAQSMGASNIVITDLFENRLNVAKSLGAMHTVLISKDKTIDCCGAESTTRLAILNTRSGGCVVIVGMGGNESKLPLINASAREVDIRGVFRYCNDYPTALALVASGKVDAKCLVTHHFDIIETAKAFETSRYGHGGAIKVMIHCQPRNNLTNLIMAKQLQNKLENREFESKLIIEIKNHFCLYAKNTEEYCNRNKRENAWVDIALIIGRRVEDCQKKWNSLRDHFRALYKNECNAPSGSGTTSKVKWVHYETLKFLIPYIAVPADDCGNYIDESYEDLIEVCFEEDSYQTQNLQNIENTADRKRKAEQRTAKPKKKKNNEDDDLDRVLKAIDNVASPSSTITKKPIQMFFDGIAIQVEHFSAIKKIELQQKVLRLLATDFADQF